ncbi:chemotaxis protein CheW [Ramlibacter sp.]|uniref:chemotaxis protein CheW n=1 Tax=Ramlibacter sp. TaxID=1917967 RepID=UPI003D09C76A
MQGARSELEHGALAPTQALLGGLNVAAVQAAIGGAAHDPGFDTRREGFRVGTLHFMVRYADGNELAEMPAVCRLPHSPGWFLGMTNLHGTLVPVFDLAGHWGTEHVDGATRMLLVLGHGDERAGIVIDGLPTRLRPTAGDRLEAAAEPPALAGCVSAVHRIGDTDWIDLNCNALLERLQSELAQ